MRQLVVVQSRPVSRLRYTQLGVLARPLTRNRDVRDFGWEIAHAAVSRRPPISLHKIVARTECYACDASVCDLSIVHFLSRVPNLTVINQSTTLYTPCNIQHHR